MIPKACLSRWECFRIIKASNCHIDSVFKCFALISQCGSTLITERSLNRWARFIYLWCALCDDVVLNRKDYPCHAMCAGCMPTIRAVAYNHLIRLCGELVTNRTAHAATFCFNRFHVLLLSRLICNDYCWQFTLPERKCPHPFFLSLVGLHSLQKCMFNVIIIQKRRKVILTATGRSNLKSFLTKHL